MHAKAASMSIKSGGIKRKRERINKGVPVHKLPGEILVTIFEGFDTTQLLNFASACRRWRDVIQDQHSLWGYSVGLKRTLPQVEKQWSTIKKFLKGSKVVELSLTLENGTKEQKERNTQTSRRQHSLSVLGHSFPFETLEVLRYNGACKETDQKVWQRVNRCTQLKILDWQSCVADACKNKIEYGTDITHYRIGQKLEESCKFKEFKFLVGYRYSIDVNICKLLCQAEKLEVDDQVPHLVIIATLHAAKDILKHFSITIVAAIYYRELDMEDYPVILSSLETFSVGILICGITAPRLESLTLMYFYEGETALLNSCKATLKELVITLFKPYDVYNDRMKSDLLEFILDLPSCIMVSIMMTSDFDAKSCWDWEKFSKKKQKLPMLRILHINGDSTLTGTELIRFIQRRAELMEQRIEGLRLIECKNVRPDATLWLQNNVILFSTMSDGIESFTENLRLV